MDKAFEILRLLNDGKAHSGAALATQLGITRGAIWNRVQRLQARGVAIQGVTGRGYRLAQPFDFLDLAAIETSLSASARRAIRAIDLALITDSTNQQLLDRAQRDAVHGRALFAEFQTAGRGRRGDRWIAPPGAGLCLSLGWCFDSPPSTMGALSLAIGIAVARAVRALGVPEIALKWPNDVLFNGRKLAGILIEMRAEFGGPSTVVIGIGLNCHIAPEVRRTIAQPVADLGEALTDAPRRNHIAAVLLNHLVEVLNVFTAQGFGPFNDEWRTVDGLAGRAVRLELPDRAVQGIARGVDASGMLLIEHRGHVESFLAGHVRLLDAV
ncbi:MAG: biotin--[acetyl-CoA-carboxylase] ligase [Gammaproteobacteria bacterium]